MPLIFEGEVRNVVVLVSETPQRFSDVVEALVTVLSERPVAGPA